MNVVHHSTTEITDKVAIATKLHNSFAWIIKGGIFLIIILGLFYLMLLNSLATQGFAFEELKAERMQIQKEMEAWDISLAIPMSLYALQSSEQVQEMENASEGKKYLYIKEGQMAYSDVK
jgi:hypothetical protein